MGEWAIMRWMRWLSSDGGGAGVSAEDLLQRLEGEVRENKSLSQDRLPQELALRKV